MKLVSKCLLVLAVGCASAVAQRSQQAATPRLVVMIVVDQMRADYVTRFRPMFTGGLARLVGQAVQYTDAHHNHAFTATAPGHASLVTGVHPARHGVVNNDWWDRRADRQVYAVADSNSPILGFPGEPGRSPANLLVPTVGDWLKDVSPRSKVFSVAIKDRVAVLMGGHRPDGAFWYHWPTGRYVTSRYYTTSVPAWLEAFNAARHADSNIVAGWSRLLPAEAYGLSRADSFPAEHGGEDYVFPHRFPLVMGPDSVWQPDSAAYQELPWTPFGDMLTFALAEEVVRQGDLGGDAVTDLLFVGASAADYVGHRYGPMSQEVQDYYARLDQRLASFLRFLDERVGRDNYLLVLTADHGVALMPEQAAADGLDARRLDLSDFRTEITTGVTTGLHEYSIFAQPRISYIYPLGFAVSYEDDGITDAVTDEQRAGVREKLAEAMRGATGVEEVLRYEDLLAPEDTTAPLRGAYLRSFHPDRAGDVVVRFKRNYTFPASLPANHLSPYPYDTHVPLFFLGPGLDPTVIDRRVWSVDVAPTLAQWVGLDPPQRLDGRLLREVIPD